MERIKSIKFGRGLQAATFRRPITKAWCRRANQLSHEMSTAPILVPKQVLNGF